MPLSGGVSSARVRVKGAGVGQDGREAIMDQVPTITLVLVEVVDTNLESSDHHPPVLPKIWVESSAFVPPVRSRDYNRILIPVLSRADSRTYFQAADLLIQISLRQLARRF